MTRDRDHCSSDEEGTWCSSTSSNLDRFRDLRSSHDPGLRAELIESYLPIVGRLARRFLRTSEGYDDLVQVGSLALVKAVDQFDPELGFAFTSYCVPIVLGELKRHLRDKSWVIRPPRAVQELCLRVDDLTAELCQDLGGTPTTEDLADAAGEPIRAVHEALAARQGYRISSLDQPLSASDPEPLGSMVAAGGDALTTAEWRLWMQVELAQLSSEDRSMMVLRYVDDMSQQDIAEHLGVSQMHVSRTLRRVGARLRERALDDDLGVAS